MISLEMFCARLSDETRPPSPEPGPMHYDPHHSDDRSHSLMTRHATRNIQAEHLQDQRKARAQLSLRPITPRNIIDP
jgi:hypothetical protein